MANTKKTDWPEGVILRKKSTGLKPYYRFRDKSEKALPVDRDSDEFATRYAEFRLLDTAPEVVAPAPAKAKTFGDMWDAYEASDTFKGLSPLTQSRHIYYSTEFLAAPITKGNKNTFKAFPVITPDAELLPLLRGYIKNAPADLPYRTACLLRTLYRFVMDEHEEWGLLRNVGNDLDTPKTESKGGHHKWEPAMLARYERVHKNNAMALAAYGIARYLGNRLSDVALLRWDALRIDHVIIGGEVREEWLFNFHQRKGGQKKGPRKGGQEMWLPVPEELKAMLQHPELVESRRKGGAIILNEWGVGFTIDSLGNKFFDWCTDADIPEGYRAHGLRANFAVELWEASAGDLSLVQVAMGHSSPATTVGYLKGLIGNESSADKIRAARAAHKERQAQILEFTQRQKVRA
jgi:integrase